MSDALPTGFRMAGFAVVKTLGRGGFGITYLARALKNGNSVAIKEYFPSEFAQRDANNKVTPKGSNSKFFNIGRDAFLEETQVLRDLPKQKGLVRVRGAYERNGTVYCVMDYIEGAPLDQMMRRIVKSSGAVPSSLVHKFLVAICPALDAIHSAGLIHRDMKPANVMLRRPDAQPILIDFGAARKFGKSSGSFSMITEKYAAIEQFPADRVGLRKGLPEGPWSDVFGLSVILYEMVSQSLPINAKERALAIAKGDADPYIPVRENLVRNRIEATYRDELLDMIDKGCSLMPDDRLESVRPYANYVQSLMKDAPLKEQEPVKIKQPGQPKQRSLASWIIIIIIFGLGFAGLFMGYSAG